MTKEQLFEMITQQAVPFSDLENLQFISGMERDIFCIAIDSFNYGVIQGKKQERRKKSFIHNEK